MPWLATERAENLLQDATSLNFVPGDAKYMAKELLEHKFSKAADIFSLGVTVLELACDLDLPNGGHLWHQLRLSGPEPSLTAKLSPELRQLIQLMMCKDSKSRPTAKQLLEMPAVIRARKERSRQLAIQGFVSFKAHISSRYTRPLPRYLYSKRRKIQNAVSVLQTWSPGVVLSMVKGMTRMQLIWENICFLG